MNKQKAWEQCLVNFGKALSSTSEFSLASSMHEARACPYVKFSISVPGLRSSPDISGFFRMAINRDRSLK